MARILTIGSKCSGCRLCEMACSYAKTRRFNPRSSRIWIESDARTGKDIQHVCRQNLRACRAGGSDTPRCIAACPVAHEPNPPLSWNDRLSIVVLDPRPECLSCRACIQACPFKALRIDPGAETLIKCDLCGGEPQCVAVCVTGALQFQRQESPGEGTSCDGRISGAV